MRKILSSATLATEALQATVDASAGRLRGGDSRLPESDHQDLVHKAFRAAFQELEEHACCEVGRPPAHVHAASRQSLRGTAVTFRLDTCLTCLWDPVMSDCLPCRWKDFVPAAMADQSFFTSDWCLSLLSEQYDSQRCWWRLQDIVLKDIGGLTDVKQECLHYFV